MGDPHGIANEGFGSGDSARDEFVIEGESVFACEAERDPQAQSALVGERVRTFFWIILKHQGGATQFEPAPSDFSIDNPFIFEGETEFVGIEGDGDVHVGDAEEGDDLLDVGGGLRSGVHGGSGARRFWRDRMARSREGGKGKRAGG